MVIFSAVKLTKTTLQTPRFSTSPAAFDPSLPLLNHLQHAIETKSLKLTQQTHAQTHSLGLTQHSLLATKLISAYSLCQYPHDSCRVFDSINFKNIYLYNTTITAFVKNNLFSQSFHLFKRLFREKRVSPDEFTFSVLSKVLGESREIVVGKMVHGIVVKNGFLLDVIVSNSLMNMYSKCGEFDDSFNLFDEMPQRNVTSWNVIISGYVSSNKENLGINVWDFVKNMKKEGLKFDAFTVSSLVSLCGGVGRDKKWGYARELHCYVVKNGLELDSGSGNDVHLGCCLVDMYSKRGRINGGRRVFDQLRYRNVFAWTAMINGYVQNGDFDEGLELFHEMQRKDGVEPNKVSLVSVLPAFSSSAGLMGGKQIHGFAIRRGLSQEVSLCNALIDMYSKCGNLDCASRVFEYNCASRDAISWSAMISGYGLHGKGQEAVKLFDKMIQNGILPDKITIVAVLSACARSGLVDEGLRIYGSVMNDHDIIPNLEMCSCIVDTLGRSGQLDRALDFIRKMPVEPGPSVWGALVSASSLHGNYEMRELAYKFLIEMEPGNPSNYISLSNVYAASARWDIVAQVRTKMKDRGLRKLPGCSWISISGETHSFFVADKSHPCSDTIYKMLDALILVMKGSSYGIDVEHLTYEGKCHRKSLILHEITM